MLCVSFRFRQKRVNAILKDRWEKLAEDDKEVWRQWTEWDKKRFARDQSIYERAKYKGDAVDAAMFRRNESPSRLTMKR
jgi:hypothetical protein